MSDAPENRQGVDRVGDNADPVAAPPSPRMNFGAVWRRLGPAGPLAVIATALPLLGEIALLGSLKWLAPWLHSHAELGLVLYAVGFAVLSGLAVLPTHAQSAVGGWSFGFARGAAGAIFGVVGGAWLGFAVARRASGTRVMALVDEHVKWRAVYDALLGGGFFKTLLIVTLLRLPPSSPFAITNLVMAAARVPYPAYLLGSFLGLAPRTAAVVFIAAGLHDLDFRNMGAQWMTIVGMVLAVVVVLIIGAMANRAMARVSTPTPVTPKD